MSYLSKSAPVIASLMAGMVILSGCGGSDNTTTVTKTTTETATVTAPPTTSPKVLHKDIDFEFCRDRISAIGSPVTSCEFAAEVRQAYLDTRSNDLSVKSPVMHAFYPMHCATGYIVGSRDAVRCVEQGGWDGSDDAVVIVIL